MTTLTKDKDMIELTHADKVALSHSLRLASTVFEGYADESKGRRGLVYGVTCDEVIIIFDAGDTLTLAWDNNWRRWNMTNSFDIVSDGGKPLHRITFHKMEEWIPEELVKD